MMLRERVKSWTHRHRARLLWGWGVIGGLAIAALVLGPDYYLIRGIAPLPRIWAMLFLLSLWVWVALRFIAGWIWAWTVMALAPVCLFVPLRDYLDAPWLAPLIGSVVLISGITVAVVVWWHRYPRRRA